MQWTLVCGESCYSSHCERDSSLVRRVTGPKGHRSEKSKGLGLGLGLGIGLGLGLAHAVIA